MDVTLKGNSPGALTAGILLLSRARSFGVPSPRVAILGDPTDIAEVAGPAIVCSNVLASCGVGRTHGRGPLVVIPGAPDAPLAVNLGQDGLGPWFEVDGAGLGLHPATQALMRLSRDSRPQARELGRQLRGFLGALGICAEPAVLDLLFAAPVPPLTRIALGLRAGRAITGDEGEPINRFLLAEEPAGTEGFPLGLGAAEVLELHRSGGLQPLLQRMAPAHRRGVESFLTAAGELARVDGGRDLALVGALAELCGHFALLPPHSILPPVDAAADAVATGLGTALGASGGPTNAAAALVDIFRFLGGRFVAQAVHPMQLNAEPPPPDRLGRWRWFCGSVVDAARHADALWRQVVDLPS